ncbi:hypothetical protein BDZ91DRAFT_794335 [Kalaharituber pfeilii]|nr:hypothetical protein BDZ91DRAFT_794335 [Kalaharituber pfeilii]
MTMMTWNIIFTVVIAVEAFKTDSGDFESFWRRIKKFVPSLSFRLASTSIAAVTGTLSHTPRVHLSKAMLQIYSAKSNIE